MNDTRVAVVTGAAGGIGRAIARRLAGDGFHVVVSDLASTHGKLDQLAGSSPPRACARMRSPRTYRTRPTSNT
ncbi:SDR family NAD(P)-dependent oxidoreductase [Actinomadura sp. KC345]|uniref:SDR family NAD(P)-dependent oxidoreductase n=1 Tax=Actinomadura sp. KC345 TaxID=2530371 RepID=UPI001FB7BCA6|nr:SDR family NAD(P)-dependent oxidoreductase [Actinomadura sp. KC345]